MRSMSRLLRVILRPEPTSGFPLSRQNRPLIPAQGTSLEKLFAKEMISPILTKHCIAAEAVWKVLKSN
jgi:hypothetical protein